jgi:hypothetical protein
LSIISTFIFNILSNLFHLTQEMTRANKMAQIKFWTFM